MTITTPPNNGCDDCAWLTEGFEERTYCPECAADIRDATELAFVEATAPGANTELAAEINVALFDALLIAMEE